MGNRYIGVIRNQYAYENAKRAGISDAAWQQIVNVCQTMDLDLLNFVDMYFSTPISSDELKTLCMVNKECQAGN